MKKRRHTDEQIDWTNEWGHLTFRKNVQNKNVKSVCGIASTALASEK